MERPRKKEHKAIIGMNGKCRLFDFDKGFNQGLEDMEVYIKSLGYKIECAVLHERGCNCERDE